MFRKSVIFFVIFLFFSFLSACISILSEDVEIELRPNEMWNTQLYFTVPQDEAQANAMLLSQSLNEYITEIQNKGIAAKWQALELDEDGNQPFLISVSGQGYGMINNTIFGAKPVIIVDETSGDTKLHFQLDANDISLGAVSQSTFTLKGGKILESNGHQLSNTTVTWSNPAETMTAVFLAPKALDLGDILVVIFMGGIIGIGIIQGRRFSHKKARLTSTSNFTSTLITYCGHCGTQMPLHARFCPTCGKEHMESP